MRHIYLTFVLYWLFLFIGKALSIAAPIGPDASGAGVPMNVDGELPQQENGGLGIQPMVNQGDTPVRLGLGDIYARGRSMVKDAQKAAGEGSAEAQFVLGWMYLNGQDVPKDERAAVIWYRQ